MINLYTKLFMVWLASVVLCFLYHVQIASLLVPATSAVISVLSPAFANTVEIADKGKPFDEVIQLDMVSTQWFSVSRETKLPPDLKITVGITAIHGILPLVLFLAAMSLMPVRSHKERYLGLIIAAPVCGLLIVLTIPVLLLGHVDMFLEDVARQRGEAPLDSAYVTWLLFLELGGIWLLPIVLAILCAVSAKRIGISKESLRALSTSTGTVGNPNTVDAEPITTPT